MPAHTFLFVCPAPSLQAPALPDLLSSTGNLSLWNSLTPLSTHVRSALTHALFVFTNSEAPLMRQSVNKWWSAVQRVGSVTSLNMDAWIQPRGKCVSETAALPTRAPGRC